MKNSKIITPLFVAFLALPQAFALQCPPMDKAPLCPQNGSILLDETYPTQSFLISNAPYLQTKEAKGLTRKFISKIIESYDFENVPQIMVSVSDAKEFQAMVDYTKANLTAKKIPKEKIKKILEQMTFVPEANYTWQQDWFESFVDLKTGAPVVKQIASYNRVKPTNGQTVSDVGSSCQIQKGSVIEHDYPTDYSVDPRVSNQSFGSGEMGGNIEGAPGGFCLVGDNQGKKFTEQFCSPDNTIQLQTSWLEVGHVDELFKIIPTQFNDGRPKECEFSLMAASPKKAFEIMKKPMNANISFMDLTNPDADPKEIREIRSHSALAGSYYLCRYAEDIMKNRSELIEKSPAVKSVLLRLMYGITSAQAQDTKFSINSIFTPEVTNSKEIARLNKSCAQNIDKVSNLEIQKMLTADADMLDLNNAIDESIEKDRAIIKTKILSRLPQCAQYYNELEVPNLFYGTPPVKNSDGSFSLPRPGVTNSFLPNPTNSVLMNKTVTFPDTNNTVFNNYLKEEMEKKKMKAGFISTWDYAHLAKGNIHCASHSLPYCRPNVKGSK